MELKPRIGAAPPAVVEAVPGSVDVEALLDAVTPREPAAALPGPVLGTLIGWDEAGEPLVAFRGEPLHALTTVPLSADHVGREVALLFVNGDVRRPLVIGVIQLPGPVAAAPVMGKVEASLGGERLEFTAGREIVFRCGDASITLTKAGKVLIQGAYLLSRSSGVNRIKGGSVQIN